MVDLAGSLRTAVAFAILISPFLAAVLFMSRTKRLRWGFAKIFAAILLWGLFAAVAVIIALKIGGPTN